MEYYEHQLLPRVTLTGEQQASLLRLAGYLQSSLLASLGQMVAGLASADPRAPSPGPPSGPGAQIRTPRCTTTGDPSARNAECGRPPSGSTNPGP
jgi:hypothetical protein